MSRLRRPATAGIAACLVVVVAVVAPYLLPDANSGAIDTYYGYGLGGPWSALAVALIGAVVFAAGRQGRTEPDLAAGAGLGVGVVATVLSTIWALTVPVEVVTQLTTRTAFEYHRHAVVAASMAIPLCSSWYAYELDLF